MLSQRGRTSHGLASTAEFRRGTPPIGGDGGTRVITEVEDRVDDLTHATRLERRAVALEHLRELFAPHQDRGLLHVKTVMGQGHSADRIGNQFGAKLVSAFLKHEPRAAWMAYQRLRPMTVGEEMAALLNVGEFEQMHNRLHQRLRLNAFSIAADAQRRIDEDFWRADANEFAGPGRGSLEELRRDGLCVELQARHAADVATVAQQLGESPIPMSEVLKSERLVTVSGKSDSKISLLIHDLIDHLWTLDLLDRQGVLDEYAELLTSIGTPTFGTSEAVRGRSSPASLTACGCSTSWSQALSPLSQPSDCAGCWSVGSTHTVLAVTRGPLSS